MTSFPRSALPNPARTASIACCWCFRAVNGSVRQRSASGASSSRFGQSTGRFARSANWSTWTSGRCPRIMASAFGPHPRPVSTTMRAVKCFFPEAARNESRSPFEIRVFGR